MPVSGRREIDMDELVAIARIARPHGLRGDLVADVLTDFPERFDGLEDVIAVLDSGERRELSLERARFQKERVLLKFAGLDSVESVESLRNADICVPEDDAVELEEGEFYDWELGGCAVETIEGERIGTVKELMRTGGTELLVVEGNGKDFLIPFAEAICVEVDTDGKLIRIDPPEGLLEF
ncbi:MAG: ribosome maturation factor RimM [Pyrinomonadaceae bacterium]|nr:ribosome maturation factor RimM [Pyrinomonadaceae bacterium]